MVPHCVYPFISWWTFGLSPLWLQWIILFSTFVYKFCMDTVVFHFLRYICRNRIAGSEGCSSGTIILFLSDCIILCNFKQCVRGPVSPHRHQYVLLSSCWIIAILVGVKWLLWFSFPYWLMTEHFFMCLLAIYIYLFGELSVHILYLSFFVDKL